MLGSGNITGAVIQNGASVINAGTLSASTQAGEALGNANTVIF